jgi:hypothetical protein
MKKGNGKDSGIMSPEEIAELGGTNIRWTSENMFEFYLENSRGELTRETRKGIVRSLSNIQQTKCSEKLKELFGKDASLEPDKLLDTWKAQPDKFPEYCYYVIRMQNPHITEKDLKSLSTWAVIGVLIKINSMSQMMGFQIGELGFLSDSQAQSTPGGTVESAEKKDSIEKGTVTEQ